MERVSAERFSPAGPFVPKRLDMRLARHRHRRSVLSICTSNLHAIAPYLGGALTRVH